jgi:hypothetical protein
MKHYLFGILLIATNLGFIHSSFADTAEKIEATTSKGDKVILLPNGRWEFVEAQKAAAAAEVAKQYPENQGCPPGAQGGHFGSRCVLVGDKDFNRPSLSGKGR